jgi:hypothetical protein
MNYPVWETYFINPGLWVAIIAVFHVFISHFAVGGGIYLWYTDRLSVLTNDQDLREFVRKHTWFFLLITMVLGGVSGVGIWFIIGIANPEATSILINQFVFFWAIEWVFFFVEIVALLIYHYKFDELSDKLRLRVALLYAISAWMSLFVINGIICFMLTPGKWLETRNPWHGFFNPSSFPSLFFRTGISIMLAGIFGIFSTLFFSPKEKRPFLLKYNVKWLYVAFPFIFFSSIWYFLTVPELSKVFNFVFNRQVLMAKKLLYVSSALIYLISLAFLVKVNPGLQRVLAFLLLFIGLLWLGSFEHIREYARRPYVIYGYLYSFGIRVEEEKKLNSEGFLKHARWAMVKEVTEDNKIWAGREIFNLQCLSCHTIKGLRNDVIEKARGFTYFGMVSQLYGQGKVLGYMPKFIGTEKEREALATFLVKELLRKPENPPELKPVIRELKTQPFTFDPQKDQYVVFVFSPLGMKCVTDADRWFSFLYPGSTFEAVVIKRGLKPELMDNKKVQLVYKVEPGFETPSKHVLFWDYAKEFFNQTVPKDLGLTGKGLNGTFDWDEKRKIFIAKGIPVLPYKKDGTYNPYPVFEIEAVDKVSGKVLQRTKAVSPVATEFRCYVCHEGSPRWNGVAGISDQTAINILKAHDKNHQTNFYKFALQGKPVFCQKCHADFIVGSEGIKGYNSFSAAIHGWHANYMPYKDEKACYLCHPDHPKGNTKCYRDIHKKLGLECVDCHGNIDFHATSLLKGTNTKTSKFLLAHLNPPIPKDQITPRKPWVQQPDCLNCHKGFQKPAKEAKGYNNWTEDVSGLFRVRKDNTQKLPCLVCHGSPHALYPAFNPYGMVIDNLQPLQYQRNILPIGANLKCEVCHLKKMNVPSHHPNLIRTFRNSKLLHSQTDLE